MTLKQLIAQLRSQAAAKLENRARMTDELAAIRAKDQVDEADEAKVEQLRTAKAALDAELKALDERVVGLEAELAADEAAQRMQSERTPGAKTPAYDQVGRVESEPRVYTAHTAKLGTSFFSDLYRDQMGRGDSQSRDRLARHQREVEVHGEARLQSRGGEYEGVELASGPQQIRAMTTSSVGSLVPPQYLLELAAPIARAGRPTANVAVHLPLPEQGMNLTVPRGTTGASAGVQATQNTAPSQTDEAWTDLTIPVGTVAGSAKLSRQTLERGGIDVDTLVFTDIAGAHGVAVDGQVLSGTGSAGQVLGLLNTAGITQMSAFVAAVTIPTLYTKVAGAIAAVAGGRYLAPDTVIAHVRRWGWLTSQMDSSNRPLVVPRACGPFNALGVWDGPLDPPSTAAAGEIQGLPWITDASVPTAVGTGPEDQVIVGRRADWLLWEEGDGMPRQLKFEANGADTMSVLLLSYSYIAFTAGRYPLATAVIGGNAGTAGFGLIAPTF